MEIDKKLIVSIHPECSLAKSGLIHRADEINRRIDQRIRSNEQKIARGMKRAQEMRTE